MTAVISHTHISSVTNVYIYIYIYKHLARACLRVYGFPVGAHVTVKSSMCLPAGSAVYLQVVLVLKKLAGLIVCFFTCLWPSPWAARAAAMGSVCMPRPAAFDTASMSYSMVVLVRCAL